MKSDKHRLAAEDFAIWTIAGAVAVALHIGGIALALANLRDVEDSNLGAPSFEVGFELASQRNETTDLPPGPEAEASVASRDMTERKAVTQPTELPRNVPTETDTPDRVVTEKEIKKPEEKEPEEATVTTPASEASVASEATAAPAFETPTQSPKTVAPAQGSGTSASLVRAAWQKELMTHLEKHKRYPVERTGKEASIVVGFELDRRGRVLSTTVLQGSGDAAFDAAAVAMLKRADPVPAPPPLLADEGLTFAVPVIFRIRR